MCALSAGGHLITNPTCTNYYPSSIGQLSYLGEISVQGHFNETAHRSIQVGSVLVLSQICW